MKLPNLYFFNPACEMEIANGSENYTAPQNIAKLKSDLELLQYFLASDSDFLVLSQLHPLQYLEAWNKIGCAYPSIITYDDALKNVDFWGLEKAEIRPWGWSPAMIKHLRPFFGACSEEFKTLQVTEWNNDFKDIYSRKTALYLLETILTNTKTEWVISTDKLASACTTHTEIELLLQKHGKIVLKSPWSSSGRGVQMLRNNILNNANKQWITNVLKQQGYIMVEPLLNKKIDFSTQWHLDAKGEFSFIGFNFFSTNSNGQYIGNYLGTLFPVWDDKIANFFDALVRQSLVEMVKMALEKSSLAKFYAGYLSVDAMIVEDYDGSQKIQPCVEINLRQNMGLIAGRISKLIHPEKCGTWKIEFIRTHAEQQQLHQKLLINKPIFGDEKLVSGVLLTTPNANVGDVCSYVEVN